MDNCLLCFEINENYLDLKSDIAKEISISYLLAKYFPFCFKSEPESGIICEKCRCQVEAFHSFYLRIESIHEQQLLIPETVFVDTLNDIKENVELKQQSSTGDDIATTFNESEDSDYFLDNQDVDDIREDNESSKNKNLNLADEKTKKNRENWKRNTQQYIPREGPQMCEICGESLLTENLLHRHIKMIHELLEFKCILRRCVESFATKKEMEKHVEKFHPRMNCPICKNVIQKSYLKTHIQLYHDKSNQSICDVCGKIFIKKTDLNMHRRFEHELKERPQCDICGRTTKDLVMMRAHMKIHFDTKQKCQICLKFFKNKKALRNHVIVHREKTIFCEICGRGFHRAFKLREHMPVHTGESNIYKCKCGSGFRFKSSLCAHKKKCLVNLNDKE